MSASATQAIHGDHVWEVLEARQRQQLRFRSAMITSTALHTSLTVLILLAPLFIPKPQIFELTPVNLVQLQAPAPQPEPPAAVEPEAAAEEPEPEPEELEPPPPEDVPEDLEAQRIAEEEAAARRREEARREREEEEERRRLADAARRRREAEEQRRREQEEEEERRRQPQKAARRETEPQQQAPALTQQAERGDVNLSFGDEVSTQDLNYLQFWINRVLTNISTKWDQPPRPPGSREIVTVIHFRVDRNGGLIVGPDVRSSSADNRYDAAAVRAVQSGQPFPPLPQAYRGRTLAINLAFKQ